MAKITLTLEELKLEEQNLEEQKFVRCIFSNLEVFPGKSDSMMPLISYFCSSHTFQITDDPKHCNQLRMHMV